MVRRKNNNMVHNFLNRNHLIVSVLALLLAAGSVFYSVFRTPTLALDSSSDLCLIEPGTKAEEISKNCRPQDVRVRTTSSGLKVGGEVIVDDEVSEDYKDNGKLKSSVDGAVLRIFQGIDGKQRVDAGPDFAVQKLFRPDGSVATAVNIGGEPIRALPVEVTSNNYGGPFAKLFKTINPNLSTNIAEAAEGPTGPKSVFIGAVPVPGGNAIKFAEFDLERARTNTLLTVDARNGLSANTITGQSQVCAGGGCTSFLPYLQSDPDGRLKIEAGLSSTPFDSCSTAEHLGRINVRVRPASDGVNWQSVLYVCAPTYPADDGRPSWKAVELN